MNATRLLLCALLACAAAAHAAEPAYPQRPIRLISPSQAAGANDVIARIMAARLGEVLNVQVVVDNRGGAGGMIGADITAKATPDGYTLLAASLATHSILPHVYRNVPYDALRDFAPVALFAIVPNLLTSGLSFGPNNVRELVALAKAKPGTINYASAGAGSASHFSGLLFAKMAGIEIVHVPYKGGGPVVTALLAGEAGFNFGPMPATMSLVQSGRLKALAVSSTTRSNALPNVPTVNESGVPGYSSIGWFGLMAPKGTPRAIVMKLNAAAERAISAPEASKQLLQIGADPAKRTPEEFGEFVREDNARYGKLIREAGIKLE
jgi:tripartite-type tricarboxylate transporter receptor subunit TctC